MVTVDFGPQPDVSTSPAPSAAALSLHRRAMERKRRPLSEGRCVLDCQYMAKVVFEEMDLDEAPPAAPLAQLAEPHAYVLGARLPPEAVLRADALREAKRRRRQHELDEALRRAQAADLPSPTESVSPPASLSRAAKMPSRPDVARSQADRAPSAAARRTIQPWELMRAIERKDLNTIMSTRDHQFSLLISKSGGVTPLVHCMRLGNSHRDVAVMLTGALSRYINAVPSDVPPDRQTKQTLMAIQSNLKLAVGAALSTNQHELISSYLQCIVMATGDKWLRDTTHSVSLALRAGRKARPGKTASDAIRTFATAELRALSKADLIAGVEDYLSNATADLLCMALWSIVSDATGGEPLPLYAFARDDRILKAFADSVERVAKSKAYLKLPKALRSMVDMTIQVLEPRALGFREKVSQLSEQLDDPA